MNLARVVHNFELNRKDLNDKQSIFHSPFILNHHCDAATFYDGNYLFNSRFLSLFNSSIQHSIDDIWNSHWSIKKYIYSESLYSGLDMQQIEEFAKNEQNTNRI